LQPSSSIKCRPEIKPVNQSDPTDNALAAIASILDSPHAHAEPAKAPVEDYPVAPPPPDGHGYSKVGPGPMAAIRFKWTVREDHGQYYVDETVGENSAPIVSGPMDKGAAMRFVDDREHEARQHFEQLKQEMAGRSAAANLVRRDSSSEA
jgi:hypothetical protein